MLISSFASDLGAHSLTGLAVAFGGGVLASLSPCLYPMIPITLSIVGGDRNGKPRHRVGLVLVYIAGLASSYSLLGLIAGLTGTMFGGISTNPWLHFAMANVMLLALAVATDTALRLPRPGGWMIGVKRLFALVLVGVAEYYLVSMGQLIV